MVRGELQSFALNNNDSFLSLACSCLFPSYTSICICMINAPNSHIVSEYQLPIGVYCLLASQSTRGLSTDAFNFKCVCPPLFSQTWQQCVWSFSVMNSGGTSMFNSLPMIGGPQAFWKVILLPSSVSVSPQRTAAFSPSPQTALPGWVRNGKFCSDMKYRARLELHMFISHDDWTDMNKKKSPEIWDLTKRSQYPAENKCRKKSCL